MSLTVYLVYVQTTFYLFSSDLHLNYNFKNIFNHFKFYRFMTDKKGKSLQNYFPSLYDNILAHTLYSQYTCLWTYAIIIIIITIIFVLNYFTQTFTICARRTEMPGREHAKPLIALRKL